MKKKTNIQKLAMREHNCDVSVKRQDHKWKRVHKAQAFDMSLKKVQFQILFGHGTIINFK